MRIFDIKELKNFLVLLWNIFLKMISMGWIDRYLIWYFLWSYLTNNWFVYNISFIKTTN